MVVDVYFLKITKDLVTCVLCGVFDIVTWSADTTEFMVIDDSLDWRFRCGWLTRSGVEAGWV
jgi:hypothetical protein